MHSSQKRIAHPHARARRNGWHAPATHTRWTDRLRNRSRRMFLLQTFFRNGPAYTRPFPIIFSNPLKHRWNRSEKASKLAMPRRTISNLRETLSTLFSDQADLSRPHIPTDRPILPTLSFPA